MEHFGLMYATGMESASITYIFDLLFRRSDIMLQYDHVRTHIARVVTYLERERERESSYGPVFPDLSSTEYVWNETEVFVKTKINW